MVDCLSHSLARLLSDRLMESVLQETWDSGTPSTGIRSSVSFVRILDQYDKLGTPRSAPFPLELVDPLISIIGYFILSM